MDIASYINSKDIRRHLRKINYKFNSLEAAWIIAKSNVLSLPEKHHAWLDLIEKMPDCEVKAAQLDAPFESLHKLLREYIDLQNKLMHAFFSSGMEDYYEFSIVYNDSHRDERYPCAYSEFSGCFNQMKKFLNGQENNIRYCTVCRSMVDNGPFEECTYDAEGRLMDIRPRYRLTGRDADVFTIFDILGLEFPVPFEPGDILINISPTRSYTEYGEIMVLEEIAQDYRRRTYDASDMAVYGYFQDSTGKVMGDTTWNYMDFEYCPEDKLVGRKRILKALSSYLKGLITPDLFMYAYHSIILEEAVNDIRYDTEFREEDLVLAGLKKEEKSGAIDIKHACCFTGHRPERLENMTEQEVKIWLYTKIVEAINDGYTDFITGMQRGVDIWAAEEVLKLREKDNRIHLFAASAFKGMQNSWDDSWKMRYVTIMNNADEKVYVSDTPGRTAFYKRNEWMVDHSSRVLAVFTGAPGGTKETINYALKNGREVITIKDGRLT